MCPLQAGPRLAQAEIMRTTLYHRVREFMEQYEFLVLPVVQVLPFDVKIDWPRRIGAVEMTTYIDWMKSCYFISVIGNPALAVPCSFASGGPEPRSGCSMLGSIADALSRPRRGARSTPIVALVR